MKKNKFTAIFKNKGSLAWSIVTLFLVILLTVVTILENTLLGSIIGTVLGGPMPIKGEDSLDIYKTDSPNKDESVRKGNELNVKIAEEGFTLLLNEDKALPIKTPLSDSSVSAKPKVSVFGKNSVNLVLGGTGSGGISGDKAKTLFDGLEKGGFEYNETLKNFYENNSLSGKGRTENPDTADTTSEAPTLDIGETPVKNYTAEVKQSFREYKDAAIVVISRIGGESFDLPRTQNTANGGIEGNHYLQLDQNEYDLLDMVTGRFDKVIVVLNTLTSFQCDFIEEYNNTETDKRIDAVLWIGGPGSTGAEAFGDILSGKINPSGKTADIYSKDFTKDPTWQNFGDGSHMNEGKNNNAFLENGGRLAGYNMVTYEEGIYLGYRYYETAHEEAQNGNYAGFNYDEQVMFPFGFGLSYTTFEQKITSFSGDLNSKDSKVNITVTVTNTGTEKGRDTVELYVHKPYYKGGIEKPYVELVDFAKTEEITVGGTAEVKFTVSAYDLASYDYNDANSNGIKGYELEEGDYTFFISSDSHVAENAYDSKVIADVKYNNVEKCLYFPEAADKDTKVENRYTYDEKAEGGISYYDDSQYRLDDVRLTNTKGKQVTRKGMSRSNFTRTFPTALGKADKDEREVGAEKDGKTEKKALEDMSSNNTKIAGIAKEHQQGKSSDLKLRDLVDPKTGKADYNDDRWDELLDKLTFKEMLELVNNGAFQTVAIESIHKNLTNDSDGPIGFVNFMPGKMESYKNNTTFACEIVISSTWNKDLAYRMGKVVGENGLFGDVDGNKLPYSGWYAPAVNLHRSPFSGRNFEYYSEDPILSGKLAVNTINGIKQYGVYSTLKHFALNDQETNRAGISTFCTEQALRELYLKPFEIAVKGNDNPDEVATAKADGITKYEGTTGIMSSFNRIGTKWTGGDYRLMTEILRNEWGFKGLVICDYKTDPYMNARQMLYAGNDLILTSMGNLMWNDAKADNAQDVEVLRIAAKNILYTVANSNGVQTDIIGYNMEWWRALTIALDVIVPVGLAVWGFFAIRKALKNDEENNTQQEQEEQL